MTKKSKIIIISSVVIVLTILGTIFAMLWNNGFTLLTYSTDNKLEAQLEKILTDEGQANYSNKVEEIGHKIIDNNYLVFFKIKDSDINEYVTVSYDQKGSFGKNDILALNRIVKGDNSVVMIDLPFKETTTDRDNQRYVIVSGLDEKEYVGINILDKKTSEVLEELDFSKDAASDLKEEKLDNEHLLIEYVPKAPTDIKLELVKKSN